MSIIFKQTSKPIIWFTGLPGSGKTTISKAFYKLLIKEKYKKIKLIDGDKFRKKIKNFNYSKLDRNKVGDSKIKFGKKFNLKGYIVLISGVASSKNWRRKIKKKNSNLIEIYIKCSNKILRKRKKNLYHENKIEKYQEGNTKDIIVNSQIQNSLESAKKIFKYLIKKNKLETN
jgi:adenylylsulfate kinase